jgi:hypothetical protein
MSVRFPLLQGLYECIEVGYPLCRIDVEAPIGICAKGECLDDVLGVGASGAGEEAITSIAEFGEATEYVLVCAREVAVIENRVDVPMMGLEVVCEWFETEIRLNDELTGSFGVSRCD